MDANDNLNTDKFLVYNLGRLEGQLQGMDKKLDEFLKRFDDHEERIDALETHKDQINVFKSIPTWIGSGIISVILIAISKALHF